MNKLINGILLLVLVTACVEYWIIQRLRKQINNYQTNEKVIKLMYQQQLDEINRRQKEAVRLQALSKKQMQLIMDDKVEGGCEGAIKYGIERAKQFNENRVVAGG